MKGDDPRAVLRRLVAADGASYAALSRMLRRNDAYLQQYVKRGTPRMLAERDRKLLAGYFQVEETMLGGPPVAVPGLLPVRRLDQPASAGAGTITDDDRLVADLHFDPRLLRQLGIIPGAAAVLAARGDSMVPTIHDGDLMLIDERDRRPGAKPAILVLRLDGALMVKRVSQEHGIIVIASDNPDYAAIVSPSPEAVEIVGRVVWLSRALR